MVEKMYYYAHRGSCGIYNTFVLGCSIAKVEKAGLSDHISSPCFHRMDGIQEPFRLIHFLNFRELPLAAML